MKVKCQPEDFQVREHLKLRIKRAGRYSVYRLEKRLWNTLDVVRDLERKHGLRHIGRGGLKDRYSLSTQFISVPGRGPRAITEKNYRLELVGHADEPVSRDVLLGNSFTVTLRELTDDELAAVTGALPKVARFGFANYYDEQRLGSARHGAGFIARKLIDGHFNGALKLYLGTPSAADDPKTRRNKTLIEAEWGHWVACARLVPMEARPVVEHLVRRPRDFKGAVELIPRPMLELFINAYQSWLWNEVLTAALKEAGVPTRTIAYSHGQFAFWSELSPEHDRNIGKMLIPTVAPDIHAASERVVRLTTAVLAKEGLELNDLRPKMRVLGVFFKSFERPARVVPERMKAGAATPDELYPGHRKLTLDFYLPTGSFATILLKRLSLF